jgi:Phycobilisome degradation protein nblA
MDIVVWELSLEQRFSLEQYKGQVMSLNPAQAQEFLLETLRQLMIKDNIIRSLMKSRSDMF